MSDMYNNSFEDNLVGEHEHERRRASLLSQIASAIGSIAAFTAFDHDDDEHQSARPGRMLGSKHKKRKRKDMDEYISSMDDKLFQRHYRMSKAAFFKLLDIIGDHLPNTGEGKQTRGGPPNGPVTKEARLSMALRYCAGGDPLDISSVHGVATNYILDNLWDVVDAIHKSPELKIDFPETHEEQIQISEGFRRKSAVDINNCVGAIDGILIWMHRPTLSDVKVLKFGALNFFCGRKLKYGLNMMAVCDSRGRFTWVEARFPGAASDYYAYDDSHLRKKIEEEGFLRPGLCLFGDNAYVNSPVMATPWRNVSKGPKDAFNFFHSQLRINIECAFGMLVHRWGVLRKPIACNITVKRTASLVYALCKLHNYCIAQSDIGIEQPLDKDVLNITTDGGLFLPRIDKSGDAYWQYDMDIVGSRDRLGDLLDGGQHMDDHSRESRRKYRFDTGLPYKRMLDSFVKKHYHRPEIKNIRSRKASR
ncbi:hypothetical protein ACHAWF_001886 [Thalassiosira exigua]